MQQFYMVDFELPEVFVPEFLALIPEQRLKIDSLMAEGSIHSYSLASNRSRLWMIVLADSEFEVVTIINELPLSTFMISNIFSLMFHHSTQSLISMSLN